MNNQITNNRIAKYDNIKLFLIFCVVLGHLVERFLSRSPVSSCVQLWIYLFHMPAFVFLAGFFSRKAIKQRNLQKCFSFLLMYIFMEIMFYFSAIYIHGVERAHFDLFHEDGIPWFCLAMFWWYLLTAIFIKTPSYLLISISIVIALLSGFTPSMNGFLAFFRTINFYPFFLVGFYVDLHKICVILERPFLRIAAPLIVVSSAVVCFIKYEQIRWTIDLFRCKYTYAQLGVGISGLFFRTAAIVISLIIVLSIIAVVPSQRLYITFLGQHTLSVYIFHGIVYSVLIGKSKLVLQWFLQNHIFLRCFFFSALLVFILALGGFWLQSIIHWCNRFVKKR